MDVHKTAARCSDDTCGSIMIFVLVCDLQVYKVMVTSDNHSWFVFRRYNEFYKLYEMLKKQVNIMCLMNTDSCKLGSTVILLVVFLRNCHFEQGT